MSEAGLEQKFIKEAFDTNWVVPLGLNVNGFEKDLEDFVNSHTDLTDSTDLVVEKTFDVFNVRSQHWQQRRTLLAEAVRGYRPDLVIVDGIRDLVNDINDGVLAQEVMEELLHLATACNCCITCVLHQNKGSEDHNLRGWIGTELMNKAFEVYACEKLLPERIFKVEQTLTRKYDIEQCMYFTVGEDGLPTACGVPTGNTATENRERLPQLNSEYIVHDEDGNWQFDLQRLFLDAMRGEEEMRHFDLQQRVMGLSNIRNYQTLAKVFADAVDKKFIVKTKNAMGQVIYQPAPF